MFKYVKDKEIYFVRHVLLIIPENRFTMDSLWGK